MIASILCPGPSLKTHTVFEGMTIAVNAAAPYYPCDYWCFLDDITYRRLVPKGMPMIVTRRMVYGRLGLTCPYREIDLRHRYTSVAAIDFAANQLHADEIRLYGCDLAGLDDYDGSTPTCTDRSDERWKFEGQLLRQIMRRVKVPVRRLKAKEKGQS